MGEQALIDLLARDGSVQQSFKVSRWPLTVGRELDNELVLDDAHTAAHHFHIERSDEGVFIVAGDSLNGLQVDGRRLARGERLQATQASTTLWAGRTHLRLRLGGHPLPPELPMQAAQALTLGGWSLVGLIVAAMAVFGFDKYLVASPDDIASTLASRYISLLGVALGWCGAWTLLSKIFNHRGHFWWHVRVLLSAVLVWVAVDTLSSLLAFSFSWPWASDFDFIPKLMSSAAALYFHLQAVEPHHRKLTRAIAVSAMCVGSALNLWNNWHSFSRFGAELYMDHLFPPALRVATPVSLDSFMERGQRLQKTLDSNARKEPDEEHPETKE